MRQLSADQIARVVYEANRALQIEFADPAIPPAPPWEEASEEMRNSAVQGVEAILIGQVGSPEEAHLNWLQYKKAHGWTLGPVKDEGKKEHPLLVPFRDLPEDARLKDALFYAIVSALRPRKTRDQMFHAGASGE